MKYSMGTLEGRIELEQVQYEKDLGVIFDTDLKFSQHIQENITKANQRIGTYTGKHYQGKSENRNIYRKTLPRQIRE